MIVGRLQHLLDRAREQRLLVVGDVMLDEFVWGKVSRISPEAPVPVVEVQSESFYPGGAANVARNLRPFCKAVQISGMVGSDAAASRLRSLLVNEGIAIDCLDQFPRRPYHCQDPDHRPPAAGGSRRSGKTGASPDIRSRFSLRAAG